jgi:hypothetical protein
MRTGPSFTGVIVGFLLLGVLLWPLEKALGLPLDREHVRAFVEDESRRRSIA